MFNRIAQVFVNNFIEINELRITFEVSKSLVGYPNQANIKIYNLNENLRNQIEQEDINIKLFAGYEDTGTALIFDGDIINVIHTKVGVDWISEIFAGDGTRILNTSTINKTLAPGVTPEQVYNELVSGLQGVVKGISEGVKNCLSGKRSLLRSLQLTGNIKDWLDQLAKDCGFEYSINDGVIETTQKNTPLSDVPPIVINQGTGMIGSPERTEVGVNVSHFLLPELRLARTIKIESINERINVGNLFFRKVPPIKNQGIYRIDKILHLGDTRGNTWESQISARSF